MGNMTMEHIRETAQQLKDGLTQENSTDPTPQSSKCAVCGGCGYIQLVEGVTRCECQKQKIIQSKLAALPARFRNASFANYVPMDLKQEQARDRIAGEFTKSYFI